MKPLFPILKRICLKNGTSYGAASTYVKAQLSFVSGKSTISEEDAQERIAFLTANKTRSAEFFRVLNSRKYEPNSWSVKRDPQITIGSSKK